MTGKATFREYIDLFVQPLPRYARRNRSIEKCWVTINRPLSERVISSHLAQTASIATYGRWYPSHAIIDIDGSGLDDARYVREQLHLDTGNSMLCRSETEGHYHLVFRPEYRDRPPTRALLQDSLTPLCRALNVETYPQEGRMCRLPFGYLQECLDEGRELLDWQAATYWFEKLDPFDLSKLPFVSGVEYNLNYGRNEKAPSTSLYHEGEELLQYGLVLDHSRHDAQFKVLYYLWRCNLPSEVAVAQVRKWIRGKHNGYSKTAKARGWSVIDKEISRQANKIWSSYERKGMLPDSAYNNHEGYITNPDIMEIIHKSGGSASRMKFLFNLIKYSYPRWKRPEGIRIHHDRLISWSSCTQYLERLHELERQGIIRRSSGYLRDRFSKPIIVDWHFQTDINPLYIDGRSPATIEAAIRATFLQEDMSALLRRTDINRTQQRRMLERIY